MKTSARWREKRRAILDRADHRCDNCGAEDTRLNIHHRYYEAGRKDWDYPDETLECLCPKCHGDADEKRRRLNRSMGYVNSPDRARGYMDAIAVESSAGDTFVRVENYDHAWGIGDAFGLDAENVIGLIAEGARGVLLQDLLTRSVHSHHRSKA
jgi:hypothetical protein